MRGVSGSGKTTVSTLLLEQARFVRIRSDAVRKQLHGLESVARSHSTTGAGIYTPRAGEETYDRLAMLAAEVLQAGFPVVADATNLGAGQRARFRAVSQRLQIPCVIVDCWAPDSTIRRWLRDRAARGGDISEADEHVLDRQQATAEMLTGSESAMTVHLRTDRAVDGPWLLDAIARKAKIPVKVDVGGAASAKCPDR
jgi:predicted kinase